MILEFFVRIIEIVIQGLLFLLPNESALPLPTWFTESIVNIFGKMKLILELPVVRIMYGYFLIWLPFWLIIWNWNFVLKIVSLIPWFSGVEKFRIKEHEKQ